MAGHVAQISDLAETRARLDGFNSRADNRLRYKWLVSRFEKRQPYPDLMPQFVSLDASEAQ